MVDEFCCFFSRFQVMDQFCVAAEKELDDGLLIAMCE